MANPDTMVPVLTALTLPDVDVTAGAASGLFSVDASDVGAGVDRVFISFDRSFNTGSGLRDSVLLYDSTDSFSDGRSSFSQIFGSASSAGTYNVQTVGVTDKAGNSRYYYTNELQTLGFDTSFTIASNTAQDTAPPTLTALTLPDVDVTAGPASGLFSVDASDVGAGVDRVWISLDRSFNTGSGLRDFVFLYDSTDSFSDGRSSLSQMFSTASSAGTYNVQSVGVTDKAGNSRYYSVSELQSLGFDTSFTIADRSNGATAYVTAATVAGEGDGSIPIGLVLKNVGPTTVNTSVTVTFLPDQSTVTNGSDASLASFSGNYSISQSSSGNYTIDLPPATLLDDFSIEGTEVLAFRVTATGQVFDTGTDTTTILVSLTDNDRRGGEGDDNLVGDVGRNLLLGGGGNDMLDGGLGADLLLGLGGNDVLIGGPGATNELYGGFGNDTYVVSAVGDTIVEQPGEGIDEVRANLNAFTMPANLEYLTFMGTGDVIGVGNDGDNVIRSAGGADLLNGGLGRDILIAGDGNDILVGGDGIANELYGGAGDDIYFVSVSGDSIVEATGGGTDQVRTALGYYALNANVEQLIYAGSGGFIGLGSEEANLIVGGIGDDILNGGGGSDSLVGGRGNDILIGGSGNNELQGGAGDDSYFVSSTGDSVIEAAGEGTDTVRTDAAVYALGANVENLLFIGNGAFRGTGNELGNLMFGGAGDDTLLGLDGNDVLRGGGGADLIEGGTGADEIGGGAGNDRLTGGSGADRFLFDSAPGASNIDILTDFAAREDAILLDRTVFSTLTPGSLAAGAFARGSVAQDGNDRILYDADSGALRYDPDGTGPQEAVQFAIVSVLSGTFGAADLFVI